MQYTTRAGLPIAVGRVERRRLDELNLPEPSPPLRDVETWGGLMESVPVTTDAGYQRALQQWRAQVWRENLHIISAALTFELPPAHDLAALQAIGLGMASHADYLRLQMDAADQLTLVEAVYYASTVTQRGIQEAETRFAYTWRGKPLSAWSVSHTFGQRGALAVDYRAAVRAGMTWAQFCALAGPEQSALVAFWNLEDRLNWLVNNV